MADFIIWRDLFTERIDDNWVKDKCALSYNQFAIENSVKRDEILHGTLWSFDQIVLCSLHLRKRFGTKDLKVVLKITSEESTCMIDC